MDFPTRNLYRSAIEELARGSDRAELEVARARRAGRRARAAAADAIDATAARDPGYHLLAGGRRAFEARSAFGRRRAPGSAASGRALGIGGYVGAIVRGRRGPARAAAAAGCAAMPGAAWLVPARRCSASFRPSTPPWRWSTAASRAASARRCCRRWNCATACRRICARWSRCRRC